jgi:hypothetical protein
MSLLAVIIVAFLLPIHTAKADSFLPLNSDYFYAYDSIATAYGPWGANLFSGNDNNKQFERILPQDSQWRVYGYTMRSGIIYYWAGGDQWIQGDQVHVVVDNESDAILNCVSRFHRDTALVSWFGVHRSPATAINGEYDDYWGPDYWWVRDMTGAGSFKNQFIVYQDGSAYMIDNSWI